MKSFNLHLSSFISLVQRDFISVPQANLGYICNISVTHIRTFGSTQLSFVFCLTSTSIEFAYFSLLGFLQTATHLIRLTNNISANYWRASWGHSINSDFDTFGWRIQLKFVQLFVRLDLPNTEILLSSIVSDWSFTIHSFRSIRTITEYHNVMSESLLKKKIARMWLLW